MMEFSINLNPNQECINFIDQIFNTYTSLYNLPNKREICFVVHELIINAVEAMKSAKKNECETIQLNVTHLDGKIKITVIDSAGGIPKEYWDSFLQNNIKEITFSNRGRGLLFVKHMVDEIWFENISETKFLVGVSKKC